MIKKVPIFIRSFLRESDKGFGYAVSWFVQRFYYRYLHGIGLQSDTCDPAASQPLTVVVPAAEKDAAALKLCLAAASQTIRHPLSAKWVVGPESEILREIARAAGWEFIHEDRLLPRPAKELRCRGWLLQQFIKLNAANHVPTQFYLVLDSDTIFLRPQTFFHQGKAVLRYSDQYELLYNASLELIFGHRKRFPVSFVTHHMLLNREWVPGLLKDVERRFSKSWWEAILQEVDKGHLISFSEFELYGNHVMNHPTLRKCVALAYWHGLDSSTKELTELETIRKQAAGRLNSVSFHQHTQ